MGKPKIQPSSAFPTPLIHSNLTSLTLPPFVRGMAPVTIWTLMM